MENNDTAGNNHGASVGKVPEMAAVQRVRAAHASLTQFSSALALSLCACGLSDLGGNLSSDCKNHRRNLRVALGKEPATHTITSLLKPCV